MTERSLTADHVHICGFIICLAAAVSVSENRKHFGQIGQSSVGGWGGWRSPLFQPPSVFYAEKNLFAHNPWCIIKVIMVIKR